MRRSAAFLLAVAVLATACSRASEDAEVLGVVLESPPAAESPTPEAVVTPATRYPDPATVVYPERVPAERPGAQQDDLAEPGPQPEPQPVPSPTVTTWVVPDGHVGEPGRMWIAEREDCGAAPPPCWIETSSTQLDRNQAPARNPLRVTLAEVTDTESPVRDAVCTGGLHADEQVAVEAHGTMVVQLLVDGAIAATSRTRVDVVIEPGSGIAAAELAGPVTVSVADTDRVECSVSFKG